LYGGHAPDFAGWQWSRYSGVSAPAAIVIGPRRSYPSQLSAPHNVPLFAMGAGLLLWLLLTALTPGVRWFPADWRQWLCCYHRCGGGDL